MNVVVVGAGKMGLPLAVQIADRGGHVVACDVNPGVVATINAGECPIDEPGVPDLLRAAVAAGRLTATTDTVAAAAQADVIIVIVPALLTPEYDVDTTILESVARSIAGVIPQGALVSFETTLPVGGTRSRILPALESAGRRAGADFDLVFSPERVKSQKVLRHLTVNPKVVGGITDEAAARGEQFYAHYLGAPIHNVGTLEAAEFVKLAGMVYRDVNIALANELAGYAEHVGVAMPQLLDAINSDGEAAVLSPGIGVGGHCTPVYPYFLIRDAERRAVAVPLTAQSRRRNDGQAAHVLDELEAAWRGFEGVTVNILGLAFRPQVREHIFSPAFLLRDELEARGAHVVLTDPLYSDEEIVAHGFTPGRLDGASQVLILNTHHNAFARPDWQRLAESGLQAVIDGRNAWDLDAIRAAGLVAIGVGVPNQRAHDGGPMPIAAPVLGEDEAVAAADVIRSGWVMQGREVAAFEREFAAEVAAPHAVAVASGTAALHVALAGLGVGPGDEVITVSHSYIATANSIVYCGADPVFVDIEADGFNIDPDAIERAITPRTRAILVVHQFGMPCDLGRILPVARAHGLSVVEDAACALGSEIDLGSGWESIGAPHGDIATFSFHPRKILTMGEGGMVTTGSAELAEAMRALRQHGTLDGRTHPTIGYNYRLTDIQAAVGRKQLRRLSAIVSRRRELAAYYSERLVGVPGVRVQTVPEWARTNWQTFTLRVRDGQIAARLIERLAERGITAKGGIANAHQQGAYRGYEVRHPLPHSIDASECTIVLPLTSTMTTADIDRVVDVVVEVLEGALA